MATILENEAAWSTTAATNANVDTGINWAEGQDAATVNNSSRGMMAARAKARLDLGGGLVAGGTANALTVTTNQVLSTAHIVAGTRLLLRATAENTSTTVTFAPDGLTPANIKRGDGSALAIGDIRSGAYLDLVYNAGSSEWRCINITPTGAGKASFLATYPSNQAVGTTAATLVTYDTETFDVGSLFAASVWAPPAGTVFLSATVPINNYSAGSGGYTATIKKNSVTMAQYNSPLVAAGASFLMPVVLIDQTDGTRSYWVEVSGTAGYNVVGGAQRLFFGYMV